MEIIEILGVQRAIIQRQEARFAQGETCPLQLCKHLRRADEKSDFLAHGFKKEGIDLYVATHLRDQGSAQGIQEFLQVLKQWGKWESPGRV